MRTKIEVLGEAVQLRSPLPTHSMGWFHACNLPIPRRAKRPTQCWSAYGPTRWWSAYDHSGGPRSHMHVWRRAGSS